ncbi:hypothetical protein CMO92_02870 [Candidatus Woesearchaeota archaeon]|nr:hypothetical protein [Candidatus Woesearchaeota archaeon]
MTQKDFNKELGSYLGKRTEQKESPFKRFKFMLQRDFEEEVPPDIKPGEIHVEYKKPFNFSRLFSFGKKEVDDLEEEFPEEVEEIKEIEQEIDELEHVEEEVEERREGLIALLINKIRSLNKGEKELEEEFVEEVSKLTVDKDLKEAFSIAHNWIEKLPPKKKDEFKKSPEFQRYKEILNNYGLIKPKED